MYKKLLFSALLSIPLLCLAQTKTTGEPRLLEPGKRVEQTIVDSGQHTYRVNIPGGALLRIHVQQDSNWIVLKVYSADNRQVQAFTWPPKGESAAVYTSGIPYTFLAEPSTDYRFDLKWYLDSEAPTSRYILHLEALPDSTYKAEQQRREATVRWLSQKALPLRSLTPGSEAGDLAPLQHMLQGVRVVGLGEATHGSREFFQCKHRLIEYLVKEMGFTVFGLEASAAACDKINDYVLYGKGNGKEALAGQKFWQWDTEEVYAMIEWMHDYNRAAGESRKVKFYGFDYQANDLAIEGLGAYLKKVAPGWMDSVATTLALMKTDNPQRPTYVKFYTLKSEERQSLAARVNAMFRYLTDHKAVLIERSSAREFEQAQRYARLLAQFTDTYGKDSYGKDDPESVEATRDRYMAENIVQILRVEGKGARMVIWTHNGHANARPYNMGYYLRKTFGAEYYAFGFSFNQGAFQALGITGKSTPTVQEFSVVPAFLGSVGWHLHQVGEKSFMVNLREAPTSGAVAQWLAAPHAMRSIGNGYGPGNPAGYYNPPVVLKEAFDGLIFIEQVSRARPNKSK